MGNPEQMLEVPEEEKSFPSGINVPPIEGMKNKHECNECHKTFIDGWKLKRHMRVHGNLDSIKELPPLNFMNFTCEVCGKRFSDNYHLKRHKRVHVNTIGIHPNGDQEKDPKDVKTVKELFESPSKMNRSYSCNQCHEFFPNSLALRQHEDLVHQKSDSKEILEKNLTYDRLKNFFKYESAALRHHIRYEHPQLLAKYYEATAECPT